MADYPDYAKVDFWTSSNWAARVGATKCWYSAGAIPAGGEQTWTLYTVPDGRLIFISDIFFSGEAEGGYFIDISGEVISQVLLGANQAFSHPFITPVPAVAGKIISVSIRNRSAATATFTFTVIAYEYSAD